MKLFLNFISVLDVSLARGEDAAALTEALAEQAVSELAETIFREADGDGDGRCVEREREKKRRKDGKDEILHRRSTSEGLYRIKLSRH